MTRPPGLALPATRQGISLERLGSGSTSLSARIVSPAPGPGRIGLRLGGAGKRSTGSEEDVSDLRGEPFTVPVDDHAFGALRIGLGGG